MSSNGVLKKILIGEKHAQAEVLIDSRSAHSFSSAEKCKSFGLDYRAINGFTRLAEGVKFQILGLCNTWVPIGHFFYTATYRVVADLVVETKIGADELSQRGKVTMPFIRQNLS